MNPIELARITPKGYQFEEKIVFAKEIYQKTDIIELKDIIVKGEIKKNLEQDIYLNASLKGTMVLPDARTLENIDYPFQIEINEKIDDLNESIQEYFEKNKNTLDIMGILWENIVLEVPISISASENTTMKGNGWELVEEKKDSIDPRLAPLRKLLDCEKE